jgi:hypothetical protein
MIGEFDFLGVFLPELIVWMMVAYAIQFVLVHCFARVGFYRYVWHRSMFDLALYIVLVGLVVLVSHRLIN